MEFGQEETVNRNLKPVRFGEKKNTLTENDASINKPTLAYQTKSKSKKEQPITSPLGAY